MGHMDLTIFSQTKCMAKVTEKLTLREHLRILLSYP